MTLLTVKELMALLRVRRSTLYALRDQGMPILKIGRSIRFDRDEVEAWIRRQQPREGSPFEPREPRAPGRSTRQRGASSVTGGVRLVAQKV